MNGLELVLSALLQVDHESRLHFGSNGHQQEIVLLQWNQDVDVVVLDQLEGGVVLAVFVPQVNALQKLELGKLGVHPHEVESPENGQDYHHFVLHLHAADIRVEEFFALESAHQVLFLEHQYVLEVLHCHKEVIGKDVHLLERGVDLVYVQKPPEELLFEEVLVYDRAVL